MKCLLFAMLFASSMAQASDRILTADLQKIAGCLDAVSHSKGLAAGGARFGASAYIDMVMLEADMPGLGHGILVFASSVGHKDDRIVVRFLPDDSEALKDECRMFDMTKPGTANHERQLNLVVDLRKNPDRPTLIDFDSLTRVVAGKNQGLQRVYPPAKKPSDANDVFYRCRLHERSNSSVYQDVHVHGGSLKQVTGSKQGAWDQLRDNTSYKNSNLRNYLLYNAAGRISQAEKGAKPIAACASTKKLIERMIGWTNAVAASNSSSNAPSAGEPAGGAHGE